MTINQEEKDKPDHPFYKKWKYKNRYAMADIIAMYTCIGGVMIGIYLDIGFLFAISASTLIFRFIWNEVNMTASYNKLINATENIQNCGWSQFAIFLAGPNSRLHYGIFNIESAVYIMGLAILKNGHKLNGEEMVNQALGILKRNSHITGQEADSPEIIQLILNEFKKTPKLQNAILYIHWLKSPFIRVCFFVGFFLCLILPLILKLILT